MYCLLLHLRDTLWAEARARSSVENRAPGVSGWWSCSTSDRKGNWGKAEAGDWTDVHVHMLLLLLLLKTVFWNKCTPSGRRGKRLTLLTSSSLTEVGQATFYCDAWVQHWSNLAKLFYVLQFLQESWLFKMRLKLLDDTNMSQ